MNHERSVSFQLTWKVKSVHRSNWKIHLWIGLIWLHLFLSLNNSLIQMIQSEQVPS